MEAKVPSPQTTLLILLGASEWPLFPEFNGSKAFAHAAAGLKAYFLERFGLLPENVLDLFNSSYTADEQDTQIGQFLEQRLATLRATSNVARDLLVYFVGHGGFAGHDSDFYLAIRRTRMANPQASGIQMVSLAYTLTEKARYLRRIIILDCCFAAAAFPAFQAGPAQVAIKKTIDAFEVKRKEEGFPAKGTALLCSSSHMSPSLLLPDGSSTMFTKALLDALAEGLPRQRDRLSLRDVKDLAADFLSETTNAPRPVVLSPDQSEGDVADIPFFPNPRTQEERASFTEEARRHQAEEAERTRRMEEEGQQRVENDTSQISPASRSVHPLTEGDLPSQLSTAPPAEITPTRPPKQGLSRRTIVAGLASLAVVGVTGGSIAWLTRPQAPITSSGAMFGYDLAHTHFNPYEHLLSPAVVSHLVPAWTASTGGFTFSSPTVANGIVYVGSNDFKLYAFHASSGQILWAAPTGGPISSSPTVVNGIVYVGSDKLYAFHLSGT